MILNNLSKTLLLTISLILIGLLLIRFTVSVVQAGTDLPPRSTPVPTSDDDDDDGDSRPLGAYLELQAANPPAEAWAVVQWQDSAGNWRDVEGWQGPIGTSGYQQWWVAAKDFNTGPFRWVVKQGAGGEVWGSSDSFNLPNGANERMRVAVSSN